MSFHPIPHARRLRDRAGRVCKSGGAPEKNHVEFSKGNQVMPRKLASPEGVAALTTKKGKRFGNETCDLFILFDPLADQEVPRVGEGTSIPSSFPTVAIQLPEAILIPLCRWGKHWGTSPGSRRRCTERFTPERAFPSPGQLQPGFPLLPCGKHARTSAACRGQPRDAFP